MSWNSLLDALKFSVAPLEESQVRIEQLGNKTNTFVKSDAANVSTVYTCLEIRSDAIARLPLDVKQETSKEVRVLLKDPLYYLLHYQPNPWTNAFNFWWAIEYYRGLTGNSYVRIIRDGSGAPVSLHIIKPGDVIGYSLYNNQIYYSYYEYKANGERKEKLTKVNGSEILHFTFGSTDGINGIDPISKLMIELGIRVKSGKTLSNYYSNSAQNKALVMPGVVNNESIKDQIAAFNNQTSIENTGKMRQIPFGATLLDLSLDLKQIQFIDSMKFGVTQIGALYRIPSWQLGILEATKFSSVEAMTTDFKVNTISPIAKLYKRELESKLLTKKEILGGKVIEFNTNALIETDQTTKNNILSDQVIKGIISPNYAARILGYPQWDGGDNHWQPSSSMFAEVRLQSDKAKLKQLEQLINGDDSEKTK